jgi:hypothetical protein
VAHYDPDLGEAVVIAPWHADWVKNIEASPALAIWIGRTHFRPVQRFLSTAEVANILEAYRRKGRLEASGIARLLGWKAELSAAERERIAAGIFAVAFSSPSTTRPAATPDR